MMYKVIKYFTDLQDANHEYHVGDTFPHSGIEVSEERLEELSTANNKQGKPLIEKVEDATPDTDDAPKKKADEEPEKKAEAKPTGNRGRKKKDA